MRKRSVAREYVIQALYNADITENKALGGLSSIWEMEGLPDEDIVSFAKELLKTIDENKEEIDKVISEFASNWPMDRMGVVDRNILRLGTAELLFFDSIPPKVTINEAVELAKKFGDSDAYKFVNGVLDKIRKELCPTK